MVSSLTESSRRVQFGICQAIPFPFARFIISSKKTGIYQLGLFWNTYWWFVNEICLSGELRYVLLRGRNRID